MSTVLFLAALWAPEAEAGQRLVGDNVAVTYNDGGTWNDTSVGSGLQARLGGSWVEFTYPGTPWQQATFEFDFGGAPFEYDGNYDHHDWTVDAEEDLSTPAEMISAHAWTAGPLSIRKIESWEVAGTVMTVTYEVSNTGTTAITDLRAMHAFDNDQDVYASSSTYETLNDVQDLDGDGVNDWAQSVGPVRGYTVGALACDGSDELGFTANGTSSTGTWATDADATLDDNEGVSGDEALHWRHHVAALDPGESSTFSFVVAFAETADLARAAALAADSSCVACDEDGDGSVAEACGGGDCDDADPNVGPGVPETWYDGVDADCDGADDFDQDGDGHPVGPDCDDLDAAAYPGASGEIWYDGVDSDCDGASDFDKDGDGYDTTGAGGGDDCDDDDPAVHPGAEDAPYDGVITDCDPAGEYDADGDGQEADLFDGEDCDDADPDVYFGADEVAGDGIDQDCDGLDLEEEELDEDIKGACGCAAPGGGVAAAWLLAAALVLARRRGGSIVRGFRTGVS